MPPEVLKSLPPVNVSNWPPPDTVAWWTLRVAIAAASLALATLVGVGIQIFLARREVDYVKRDLDNNEKLLKELMRRPHLELTAAPVPWLLLNIEEYLPVQLVMIVTNRGSKSAHEIMVELLLPDEALHPNPADPPQTYLDKDGKAHARIEVRAPKDTVLYSNGASVKLTYDLRLKPDAESFTIYYRLYDEYDVYPNTGDYLEYLFERSVFGIIRDTLRAAQARQLKGPTDT
jgi:hypothetical protein